MILIIRNLYAYLIVLSVIRANFYDTFAQSKGKNWALLVAGSNGYFNYRHQADVCHSYHIIKDNGIPAENIIVMMYDDIAYNKRNPTPGIVINHPGGKDVYKGVPKDYVAETVTPENFLNILKGNSSGMRNIGNGKVIDSGPDDTVFVYFTDHGGAGVLSFPSTDLTAADLIKTFNHMANNGRFSKLILYVEACESGSMFENILDDNLNIFVMTASDPNESSFACYYDEKRKTYLGDVFSVNWMQEAERMKSQLKTYSLHHIFEKVRTDTNTSHIEEYGDLDIGNTKLSEIITSNSNVTLTKPTKYDDNYYKNANSDAISSRQVPIEILRREMTNAHSETSKKIISKKLELIYLRRRLIDEVMEQILTKLTAKHPTAIDQLANGQFSLDKTTIECHDKVVKTFSKICFSIAENPYATRYMKTFVNACHLYSQEPQDIIRAIRSTCTDIEKNMVGIV